MKVFLALIFFLSFNQIVFSKIVKSTAEYKHLGDEISQKEACLRAEKKAKENAIKKALGLKVSLEETQKCKEVEGVYDCEQNQVSVLSLNGEIIESSILRRNEGVREDGEEKIYFCAVEIQADVEAAFKKDENFQFEVNLNKNTFKEGEKLKIKIISGQEMYLNIFQWFPYEKTNKVVQLFPNNKEKNNNIDSKNFELPTSGLSYYLEFPKNMKERTVDEHLIFIATKKKIKWLYQYFSLEDLNKRLIEIGKNNVVSKEQKTYTLIK